MYILVCQGKGVKHNYVDVLIRDNLGVDLFMVCHIKAMEIICKLKLWNFLI